MCRHCILRLPFPSQGFLPFPYRHPVLFLPVQSLWQYALQSVLPPQPRPVIPDNLPLPVPLLSDTPGTVFLHSAILHRQHSFSVQAVAQSPLPVHRAVLSVLHPFVRLPQWLPKVHHRASDTVNIRGILPDFPFLPSAFLSVLPVP